MDIVTKILVLVLSAAVGEAVIEFLLSPLLDLVLNTKGWLGVDDHDSRVQVRTVIFNCASAILGVLIAINFGLGLFAVLGTGGVVPDVDFVLTGIVVGRGSNFMHGFVNRYLFKKEE